MKTAAEWEAECIKLERENDVLRGLAARVVGESNPCHYCGVTEIVRCPSGFPGCGLADDLVIADKTIIDAVKRDIHSLALVLTKFAGKHLSEQDAMTVVVQLKRKYHF